MQEIEISTNAFEKNPAFFELQKKISYISVNLRNCEAGEEFTEDGKYYNCLD